MDKIYLELSKFKDSMQQLVINKINYLKTLGMTQKESKIVEITKFVKNLVAIFNSLIYVGLIVVLGNLIKFGLFIFYKINDISVLLNGGYFWFIQKLKGLGILFTQNTFEIVYLIYWSFILIFVILISLFLFYIISNILKFFFYGLKWLNTQRKELTQFGINIIEKESKLEEKTLKSNYLDTFDRSLIIEYINKNKYKKKNKMFVNLITKIIQFIKKNKKIILLVFIVFLNCVISFILLNKIILLGFQLKGIRSIMSFMKKPTKTREEQLLEEFDKILKDRTFQSFTLFMILVGGIMSVFSYMYEDRIQLFKEFLEYQRDSEKKKEFIAYKKTIKELAEFKEYQELKKFFKKHHTDDSDDDVVDD